MKAHHLEALRRDLPEQIAFLYYPDREAPWLLARHMGERARVADLKAGPLAPFLERPLVKPVVAASGGTLARADLDSVAMADRAVDGQLTKPAAAGVAAAFDAPWFDFEISLDEWHSRELGIFSQTSRAGRQLVLQLNFPAEDVELMVQYLGKNARRLLEYDDHPVRLDGARPTLAWVRLDIEGDVALIEEIQSDWLRFAARISKVWLCQRPYRQFTYAMQAYEEVVRERYEKLWPRATMLAALGFLRDIIGVKRVFMHQPAPGAALKAITGRQPPKSLYTQLPKSFGFSPTSDAPRFLARRHRRRLAPFRRSGQPVFWQLDL